MYIFYKYFRNYNFMFLHRISRKVSKLLHHFPICLIWKFVLNSSYNIHASITIVQHNYINASTNI